MSPELPVLIAGYGLAVPGTLFSPRIMRERKLPAFVALELGTAMIVCGWAIHGRDAGVAINAAAFAGFAGWWLAAGR